MKLAIFQSNSNFGEECMYINKTQNIKKLFQQQMSQLSCFFFSERKKLVNQERSIYVGGKKWNRKNEYC